MYCYYLSPGKLTPSPRFGSLPKVVCEYQEQQPVVTNVIEKQLKPRLYEDGGLLKVNIFFKFH